MLFQPRALEGRPEGIVFAVLCIVSLALIDAGDVASGSGVTVGSFQVVPLIAAGWLLSDRLLVVVAAAAMLARVLPVETGGLDPVSAAVQVAVVPFVALVARTAAVAVKTARDQTARQALASTITAIASSANSLQEILDGILSAIAREGLRGGVVALIDERDQLYVAAVERSVTTEPSRQRLALGEGVLGRVAAEGRPILIGDLKKGEAPLAEAQAEAANTAIRSLVAVPLIAAGHIIGVLEVNSEEADRFDESDVALLEQVALAVSGAVQRAGALQLADELLKRRVRELSILLDAAQGLASSLDLKVLIETVSRCGAEIALGALGGARRGSVIRVEGQQATLIGDYDERGDTLVMLSFPLDDHPGVRAAVATGTATTCRAADLRGEVRQRSEAAGLQSGAYAPIRVGTGLWGILSVATREDHEFGPADLRLLQGVADLAGLAIANSELLRVERTRSDQLREHGERMAALDHAKSEFLRLASHELRGPLGVLRGYLSMLADGSLGQLPASAAGVMPILTAKVGEINMLIDQMLETARLEDSRLQLTLEETDLRELVTSAVDAVRPAAGTTHRLSVSVPERPVTALVDRARILTILTNLLDNAIKYSPEGGAVSCELLETAGTARITVHDEGLGIDPRDLSRLFTRFGRLVTRDNSHIAGTGLGLYLSRELARMHHGDITVSSVPGTGSTFVLELPATEAPSQAVSA